MDHCSEMRSRLASKRLLIFDFDGTLAATSPLHAEAFAEVLNPFGVTVQYPEIAGLKTADALARVLSKAGISLPTLEMKMLVRRKQTYVRALIHDKLQPLPGVDRFLAWARDRYQLAICSSGSRGSVEIALSKLGYDGWFDPVVCAEDVVHAKPDPEGFLRILEISAVKPRHALIFEDSDAGLVAAERAACDVVQILGDILPHPAPTRYYTTWSDIKIDELGDPDK